MNLQELIALAEGFKDLPLAIRRRGWELWRDGMPSLDQRNKWVSLLVVRSPEYTLAKCCPWGTAIIAVCEASDVPYALPLDGMPGHHTLGHLIGIASHGTLYLSDEAATQIKPFMHLIDAGQLTDDQIHRIMVPEDFPSGA